MSDVEIEIVIRTQRILCEHGTNVLIMVEERTTISSTWNSWDRDFAEAEEVNSLTQLLNVASSGKPICKLNSVDAKGRSRLQISLSDCSLPNLEHISNVGLKHKSEKYCKVIGRGRGRRSQVEKIGGRNVGLKEASNVACYRDDVRSVIF